MGLQVAPRVSVVQPTSELQRALEAPARERIQQQPTTPASSVARAQSRWSAPSRERDRHRIELVRCEEELIC
jgi:hypothetical protein